jgi:hypothetical protein
MTEPESGNIVVLRGRMSDAEYTIARAKLAETYGETSIEAAAKRDQALALLFHRSGWTQEELARKEGKTQQWVAYRMRFGRFLNFTTAVVNAETLPANLTEGRFRAHWEQADKDNPNERMRFQTALRLIHGDPVMNRRRRQIGETIKEQFANGKWHKLSTISQGIEADEEHVRETLDGICKNQTYGCKAEKKRVGTHVEYRLYRMDKTVSVTELFERLEPIIKRMQVEGRKNMATMSPHKVAILASELDQLLHEWTE